VTDAPTNTPPTAAAETPKPEKSGVAPKATPVAPKAEPTKTPAANNPAPRDSLARMVSVVALAAAIGALALSPALQMTERSADPQPQLRALEGRLAALKQDVADLKARPEPTVTAMPTPVATATPAVDPQQQEQLHNALTEIATLREKLTNLQQGVAGAEEVKQQLTQLKNDLAVANTAISSMRGHVQQMTDSAQQVAAAESATRTHVIAFLELRGATASASPFEKELQALCNAAKTIAAVAGECAKLEKPSQAGVATLPMLQSRFAVMAPSAERAVALAEAKDWTDRLKVSLDEVVHIRKIGDTGNTETPKLVHEASAALQRGNLPEAVVKVEAMPELAQKELQEWLGDARARLALEGALTRLGAALGQTATPVTKPDAISIPEGAQP